MQNEVVEEKTKKPLSKKRIAAIVALSLVVVLLLVPIVNQCIIELFNGELYEQDGRLQNTHVYIENAYVEDGVLHYTVVNDTIKALPYIVGGPIDKYVDGEWVECEFPGPGLPPLGNKRPAPLRDKNSPRPTVPAFGKIELTRELADYQSNQGTHRFWVGIYPEYSFITYCLGYLIPLDSLPRFVVVGTFEIPAAS